MPYHTIGSSDVTCATADMSSRASLAVFVAHATHNWAWYLLLSWLPLYLTQQGVPLETAGGLALVPYLLALVLANAGAATA